MPSHPPAQERPGGTAVEFVCRQGCRPGRLQDIDRTMRRVLRTLGRRGRVCVLFTDDAEIRSLNRRFRRIDRATDVLSFPWDSSGSREDYLGDIAISLQAARRQAGKAGWPLYAELRFLVLHALLHLLGHDHETDSGQMNRLQEKLARKLLGRGISGELVSRRQGS